jgi:hypothetical protein
VAIVPRTCTKSPKYPLALDAEKTDTPWIQCSTFSVNLLFLMTRDLLTLLKLSTSASYAVPHKYLMHFIANEKNQCLSRTSYTISAAYLLCQLLKKHLLSQVPYNLTRPPHYLASFATHCITDPISCSPGKWPMPSSTRKNWRPVRLNLREAADNSIVIL